MTNFINNVHNRAPTKRDDNNAEHHFGVEDGKLTVELYDYSSNPVIKDTDFDGVPDGKGYAELQRLGNVYGKNAVGKVNIANPYEELKLDEEPQSNKVSGEMRTTNDRVGATLWFSKNAETHMDYRYFFMNNKNYYDELSTMSLMLCNTLEHNENSGSGDLSNLTTLFRRIGLKKWNDEAEVEIKIAKYGSNGEVKYVVGENEIEYTHNYTEKTISKKVKLIVVKSIDAGKDNIEKIGNNKNNINNHELFEGLAKAIYDKEFKGQEFCYWVTGYNTGGAVANVLAAKMIDNGLYYVPKGNDIASGSNAYVTFENGQKSTQAQHTQVITNVYAYTFGAPYTIYNGKEVEQEVNTIADKYCSIFNVVSNADISAYMMPHLYKWGRYGVTCYKVQEEYKNFTPEKTVRMNIEDMFRDIYLSADERSKDVNFVFDNSIEFKNNYYKKDYGKTQEENLKLIFDNFMLGVNIPQTIANDIKNNQKLKSRYAILIESLNKNRDAVIKNRDEKIYYELSKKILPEDISFIVNTESNRPIEIKEDIYSRFPCFQSLANIELIGNVEIPMMFQSKEVWYNFKFGKDKETKIGPGGCSVTSAAMILSWITKKEITPPDVRNMLDNQKTKNYLRENKDFSHTAMGEIPGFFNVVNLAVEDGKNDTKVSDGSFKDKDTLLYYLKKGKPLITRTDGGYLKTSGHFFVIAGIGKYDKKGNEITNIDTANKDDLLIYICDPKYSNQENNSVCTKSFTFDQIMGRGSDDLQATKFWVFDVDSTHKGDFTFKDGSDFVYEFNDLQCTSINQKYIDEYKDVLGTKGWKMP